MKDYLDDLLVCAIIIAILIPIIIALFKRKRVFVFIIGVFLVLGAIPVAIISEMSMNGCCGAPSTGYEGTGYIIGGIMAIIGLLTMAFSKKLAKQ